MTLAERYRDLMALLYAPELTLDQRSKLEREHAQKVAAVMARDASRKEQQQGLSL